jgi:hypothetical protein
MIAKPIPGEYEKFTIFGKWATVTSLFFIFSISAEYRLGVGGFLVHPYLLVIPISIFLIGFNFKVIPTSILYTLFLFYIFFAMGSLQNINPSGEIIKVGASLFTFIFFIQAVHTSKDFRLMAWGYLAVAVTIGVIGFSAAEEVDTGARLAGINALEGIGNKNAQSLFTLPGLFFSVFLISYYLRKRKILLVAILLTGVFFIVIQTFLSANRSGYLGLFIIFISYLTFFGLNFRTIFVSIILILFTYLAVEKYASDVFERKRQQTVEGYGSDVGRQILIVESLKVGLEHPILGIGFDNLTAEMATRLGVNRFGIFKTDTHFLFGYLFGATGIFSLFFFLLFLLQLCQKRIRKKETPVARKARILVVSFVVLFFIRSFFTREILYSPTFMGGLGLVLGYYLMHVRNVSTSR